MGDDNVYYIVHTGVAHRLSSDEYVQLLRDGKINLNPTSGQKVGIRPIINSLDQILKVQVVTINTIYIKHD